MNVFAQPLLFTSLVLAIASATAKEIPVTSAAIKSHADALFIGQVTRIRQGDSRLSIEMTVLEKFFDRGNSIAGTTILNLRQEGTIAHFKPGEKYVFAASTCSNGAHVLLGRQYAAKVRDGSADTGNWHGFGQRSSLATLRSQFEVVTVRDHFVGEELCKLLFDCDRRGRTKSKDIP